MASARSWEVPWRDSGWALDIAVETDDAVVQRQLVQGLEWTVLPWLRTSWNNGLSLLGAGRVAAPRLAQ